SALLLVAADAEGALAGAGQADHPHLAIRPGRLEAGDQLVDGVGGEGVQALRPVDRDRGQAVLHLVADIGQVLHSGSFQAMVSPPLTESVWPVMKPASSEARK